MQKKNYLIVEASALPDVFMKVLEAKRLMESGETESIQDAVCRVGISRSAFYKYRNLVFPFYENTKGRTITVAINLDNVPGLLSNVLNAIAEHGANILTINQTIPINDIANLTITIEAREGDTSKLFETIEKLPGVLSLKIIARE